MKSITVCVLLVSVFICQTYAVPLAILEVPLVEVENISPVSLIDIENADQSKVDSGAVHDATRSPRGLGLLLGKFSGGFGGLGGLGELKGFGGLGGLGAFGGLASLKGFGGRFGGGYKPFFGKF